MSLVLNNWALDVKFPAGNELQLDLILEGKASKRLHRPIKQGPSHDSPDSEENVHISKFKQSGRCHIVFIFFFFFMTRKSNMVPVSAAEFYPENSF